jgi:hypothetical protein
MLVLSKVVVLCIRHGIVVTRNQILDAHRVASNYTGLRSFGRSSCSYKYCGVLSMHVRNVAESSS